MAAKSKTIWETYCRSCGFTGGQFNGEADAKPAARKHHKDTQHKCEPRSREVDLCLTHGDCLKIGHCPHCHVPFPLMVHVEPEETAMLVVQARATVERHKEPCSVWTSEKWQDTVYACGCVEHDGHCSAMSVCKAHQPVRKKTHTQGHCYACDAPLTKTARTYQRKLDEEIASLFPCEQAVETREVFAA